ncbi:MAG: hypothetical protein ACRC35_11035 [Angustibacter sp.]
MANDPEQIGDDHALPPHSSVEASQEILGPLITLVHPVEPLIHPVQTLVQPVEPLIHPVEPSVHLIEPLFVLLLAHCERGYDISDPLQGAPLFNLGLPEGGQRPGVLAQHLPELTDVPVRHRRQSTGGSSVLLETGYISLEHIDPIPDGIQLAHAYDAPTRHHPCQQRYSRRA